MNPSNFIHHHSAIQRVLFGAREDNPCLLCILKPMVAYIGTYSTLVFGWIYSSDVVCIKSKHQLRLDETEMHTLDYTL